ncbi:MAG: hypothetical protein JKY37_03185 [Nannocystaceae bacterium]|nr:hypothetical protein [Nannocystaceae bacterium]
MANRRSKFLVLGLAAATAYGAWTVGSSLLGDDDTETEATKHVVNQVWLERLPANHRDMVGHLAIVKHPQGQVGIAGRSSQWRHSIDVFMWKLEGHRLEVYFPQDEMRSKVRVSTYECEGEAPHPFELCMDVEAGDRKATYYSRRDWKIEPNNVEESLETFAETYPTVAQSIVAEFDGEVDGEVSARVLDSDASEWRESDALPW